MRASARRFSRYIEVNSLTGLTGLHAHPAPRPALINLYESTLERLQKIPATSVYRQSVEAVTKHRLELVKATQPSRPLTVTVKNVEDSYSIRYDEPEKTIIQSDLTADQ